MKILVEVIDSCTWILSEGDTTFECSHDEPYRVDTVEVDTMRNGEHDTYNSLVAICPDPDCDITLEDVPTLDFYDESDDR